MAFCTFLSFTANLDVEFFENLQLVVVSVWGKEWHLQHSITHNFIDR